MSIINGIKPSKGFQLWDGHEDTDGKDKHWNSGMKLWDFQDQIKDTSVMSGRDTVESILRVLKTFWILIYNFYYLS